MYSGPFQTNVSAGARNSFVRIFDDRVEKYTSKPARTARKYAAVHDVGLLHGFLAPRVLAVREDCVVLERIRNIASLRELYMTGHETVFDRVIERAGEVLARLHTHLPCDNEMPWIPTAPFVNSLNRYSRQPIDLCSLPRATLHCDYSFANIFVPAETADQLVVIDPCANFGSTFDDWARGPIYVDIGKMLACLEGQIPARRQFRRPSPERVAEMQRLFMLGYEAAGLTLEPETAHAFAFAVAAAQFRRRNGVMGAVQLTALYNRLRRNYPASAKLHQMRGIS